MTPRATIKRNVAEAIAASEDVRAFCVDHFGRGALVIVDWFGAQGAPGVNESPYVLLYSRGEDETGQVDEESFEFTIEVGAVASKSPRREVDTPRTKDANGLVVNGCAAELEELREIIVGIVKGGAFGAPVRSFSFDESSSVGWPLEYAAMHVTMYQPRTVEF